MANNVLRQRIITALVLVPLILMVVMLTKTIWLALLFAGIVCLGAWEWTKFGAIYKTPSGYVYVIVTAVLLAGCWMLNSGQALWVVYAGALWWVFAAALVFAVQRQIIASVNSPLLKLFMGIAVLIPAWLSLVTLHGKATGSGAMQLIFILLLIWTADIAAYFTGKKWGRHQLAARVSPGKTWEGVGGAILASGLLGYLYAITLKLQLYDIIIFLIVTVVTVAASITGDLLESLMKRSVNIKDSGRLLPGHGGVLDRIDSLTAAAPVYLAATSLAGLGT